MSVTNPEALHLSIPNYPLDQIIGVFTGTVSLAAPGAFPGYTVATDTHITNFGDSCYFQGIFTQDGGVTWNDFGSQVPNTTPPFPFFQSVNVQASADATNLYVYLVNRYDNSHSIGTAYTVTYKVFVMAKNTMAKPLAPLPTNQILAFDSRFNFQQITSKGVLALTVASGNTGSVSVIHNLGYIPYIRAFFLPTTIPGSTFPISQPGPLIVAGTANDGLAEIQAQLTTSTLTFYSDQSSASPPGISGNVEYRLYLGANNAS